MIPVYLPGWRPGEGDVGLALIHIFAHMAEEVIQRLNQVPRKHFTAFLDMMGISLLPASAARVPLTFRLSRGAASPVPIPQGTTVAGSETGVVFETENSIRATPAELVKVVVSDGLYLGFDRKIPQGSVSIFFSLAEPPAADIHLPRIHWFVSAAQVDQGWRKLEAIDFTRGLTESGMVEFTIPDDFSNNTLFGEDLFWIKGTGFGAGAEQAVEIKGVHVNTVFASQVETVEDEIVGSSDGGAGQAFCLRRTPVLAEEIWVDETRILTVEGKQEILEKYGADSLRENIDETGGAKEIWIRWEPVEDFFGSGSKSRHYVVERVNGCLRFGDGVHGMIPAVGADNIRANYRVGGGRQGNIGSFGISKLRTSIPFVDSVTNPEAAEGGGSTEQIAGVFTRGPRWLRHRNRAVTVEDFERIAADVSSRIARIRCVLKNNHLFVMVIPVGREDRPLPSAALMEQVKRHIVKYALNTLPPDRIVVRKPQYVDVSISADIFPASKDTAVLLEARVIEHLKEFLHPLSGGPEKKGWDFGRDLHLSDVYALLESVAGVDHVANLRFNGEERDVKINAFQTLCSGEHRLEVM